MKKKIYTLNILYSYVYLKNDLGDRALPCIWFRHSGILSLLLLLMSLMDSPYIVWLVFSLPSPFRLSLEWFDECSIRSCGEISCVSVCSFTQRLLWWAPATVTTATRHLDNSDIHHLSLCPSVKKKQKTFPEWKHKFPLCNRPTRFHTFVTKPIELTKNVNLFFIRKPLYGRHIIRNLMLL